jgi:hypothetical protein
MPFKQWLTPQWKEYRKSWRLQNKDKVAAQNKRSEQTRRAWRYRTEYKANLEHYNKVFIEQKGLCALCEKPQNMFKYRFAMDHNHKTGEIRGLLCFTCNTRLAVIEDSLFEIKAKEYLRRYSHAV